jgi:8-oxo-dGTP pyrophosphatase MutT (NUDIX family)
MRKISVFVPYRLQNGKIFVYLQKRAKDAKRAPDLFGLFGGGIEENETAEEALKREIKEELNYIPKKAIPFKIYETNDRVANVFIEAVDELFEDQVQVLEGEYGKWFEAEEALNEPKLIDLDKVMIKDLCGSLGKNQT